MKRSTTMLIGLGAAGALFLAGCGGSDTAAPSTSATQSAAAQTSAATSTSSAATSAAAITTPSTLPSSSMETDASMSMAGPTATTTVGGDTTTLDPTSAAWFDTTCSGLAPLTEIAGSASSISDPSQLGAVLTKLGDAMTTTATTLQSTPAPTFEGGDALAAQTTAALQKFGPTLSALGAKAATISPTDQAAGQAFVGELTSTFSELPTLLAFDVSPELQKSIAAVPSCAALVPAS